MFKLTTGKPVPESGDLNGYIVARLLVYDVLIASLYGSSLAAMPREGANAVKDEIARRLKLSGESMKVEAFRKHFEAAADAALKSIEFAEVESRRAYDSKPIER